MKPRIKFGLIAGLIGLVLSTCISSALDLCGICSTLTALLAGAAAGFLAARQEEAFPKENGVGLGAIAGSIAGVFVLFGRLLGSFGALAFLQFSNTSTPPAEASQQISSYIGILGIGLCYGIIDIIIAAVAGAAAGYVGAPDHSSQPGQRRMHTSDARRNHGSLIEETAMAAQVFTPVWYRPDENKWSDMNLLAFQDSGLLIVKDDSLEFEGQKHKVTLTQIKRISIGKQGRDFINNWIKVEYGDPPGTSTAFFADGSWLGWGGAFGGTQRIFSAIRRLQNNN